MALITLDAMPLPLFFCLFFATLILRLIFHALCAFAITLMLFLRRELRYIYAIDITPLLLRFDYYFYAGCRFTLLFIYAAFAAADFAACRHACYDARRAAGFDMPRVCFRVCYSVATTPYAFRAAMP